MIALQLLTQAKVERRHLPPFPRELAYGQALAVERKCQAQVPRLIGLPIEGHLEGSSKLRQRLLRQRRRQFHHLDKGKAQPSLQPLRAGHAPFHVEIDAGKTGLHREKRRGRLDAMSRGNEVGDARLEADRLGFAAVDGHLSGERRRGRQRGKRGDREPEGEVIHEELALGRRIGITQRHRGRVDHRPHLDRERPLHGVELLHPFRDPRERVRQLLLRLGRPRGEVRLELRELHLEAHAPAPGALLAGKAGNDLQLFECGMQQRGRPFAQVKAGDRDAAGPGSGEIIPGDGTFEGLRDTESQQGLHRGGGDEGRQGHQEQRQKEESGQCHCTPDEEYASEADCADVGEETRAHRSGSREVQRKLRGNFSYHLQLLKSNGAAPYLRSRWQMPQSWSPARIRWGAGCVRS